MLFLVETSSSINRMQSMKPDAQLGRKGRASPRPNGSAASFGSSPIDPTRCVRLTLQLYRDVGSGHSRLGQDDGRSSHFRYPPIATGYCDATKNRDVPIAEVGLQLI